MNGKTFGLTWQQWTHFFKLMAISCLIFFGSFVILASCLVYFNKDIIKNIVVSSVNKNLTTRVDVEEVDVSFLRSFPFASVYFSNVKAYATQIDGKDGELLSASTIYLRFRIWDIIKGSYKINELEVNDLNVYPVIDAHGNANYLIWKKSDSPTDSTKFSFNLQRVKLNKASVSYHDYKNNRHIDAFIPHADLRGHFSEAQYDLTLNTDVQVKSINWEQSFKLENKNLSADVSLFVENNNVFHIHSAKLDYESHLFDIGGLIDNKDKHPYFDLIIESNHLELQRLIGDIPESYSNYFEGFKSRGELDFKASVKGFLSPVSNPLIKADFGIQNGSIAKRGIDFAMKNISFTGSFSNGQRRNLESSQLKIFNFTSLFNNGFLNGKLSVENLESPNIILNINTEADLTELSAFYKPDTLLWAKGRIAVSLDFQSRLTRWSDFSAYDFIHSKSSGEAKITDVSFALKDSPLDFNSFNGHFAFSNNDIDIIGLAGKAGSSDFSINGSLINILPYLFVKDQALLVDADFSSNNLNFDELVKKSSSSGDTTFILSFSDMIRCDLNVKIGALNLRKFNASNIQGQVKLKDKKLVAQNISLNTMDGSLIANGLLDASRSELITISLDGITKEIDIQKLFYQLGNFGQESLKSDNIKGKLTADVQFTSKWSPSLDIDWGSLKTTANIIVKNGELLNYEPMMVLSRFIKVSELQHILFSTLENQIQIQDRLIIIPSMEIKSSALDIRLSGTHSFENVIDYRFQILLSDLLWNKARNAKKENEEFGQVVDDGLGRTTLFIALTGTVDEPILKYDRIGVREKIKDDMRKERQSLKEMFREEFNLDPREEELLDTNSFKGKKREETKQIKKQEKGEFVIEWD
ncbi:MAG: AsmA-like C-terminal region-containing protein [Bacteroidales bacterium]|nr:AsmA-like C-terminal region-containing protein [Bacteroidales bacterium]